MCVVTQHINRDKENMLINPVSVKFRTSMRVASYKCFILQRSINVLLGNRHQKHKE